MNLIAIAAISFFITVLAMLALRPLAQTLDLVDRPGGRKTHTGEIPLVGGLAMFIGIAAGLGLVDPPPDWAGPLLGVFAILISIGLLDDRFSVSRWMRLGVHAVAAIALIAGTGVLVTHLGAPFGGGAITLHGPVAWVLTALLVVAAINTFNMLDGMDGLAGMSALTSIGGLAWLAGRHGIIGQEGVLCAVAGAATCAFLCFNVPARFVRHRRCFMGDAGSTLLGAAIAWLCIRTSQHQGYGAVQPVTVLWFVALPLFELFWTVIRRMMSGSSPMLADTNHFHHQLVRGGLSVHTAFMVFTFLNVMMVFAGLVLDHLKVPDVLSLTLLAIVGSGVVRLMYRAQWLTRLIGGSTLGTRAIDESAPG